MTKITMVCGGCHKPIQTITCDNEKIEILDSGAIYVCSDCRKVSILFNSKCRRSLEEEAFDLMKHFR